MNKKIHPDYFNNVVISCACGASLTTGSVAKGPIHVDICSNCHPFFTGEKRLIDTEGRADRFERKVAQASVAPVSSKKKKAIVTEVVKRKSLREMLQEAQG